jgi:branched-subunit amino acid ABC-type transport system permease component
MSDYLLYVVFGVSAGAIYGLSAMGLVLTYKTSGLFNFGHGAVSALAAFTFYSLFVRRGLPWPVAAALAVVVFGLGAGLLLERMAAALAEVPTTYKIIATVGLLVGVRGLAQLLYGSEAQTLPTFLPQGTAFTVSGATVSYQKVIAVGVGVVAAVGLYLLFRVTRLGMAMRAVVDDAALLDMTGISPARVRRTSWLIGGVFASLSGVLFAAEAQQVDVDNLTLLVVKAFGAAAIGRFVSLPMAFAGGIGVGIVEKLVSQQVVSTPALNGLDNNVPFLVLFLTLLVLNRSKLVEVGRQVKAVAVPASRFDARQRTVGYAVALGGALALPSLVGAKLPLWNAAMAQVVLFLSLGLLVRVSGQISLCHIGFAAVGAAAFGHVLAAGVPWLPALLLAGLLTVPVGALIAIPAIRLSGLYLALSTFGFGVLLAQFFYTKSYMFGIGQRLETRRPGGLSTDTRYYFVLLAIAVIAALVVAVVEHSRIGRLLRALADSPVALSTLGLSTNITLVLVFCLSAGLAGISGATYAALFGRIGGFGFPFVQSLTVLAVLAIAGRRTITTAFAAPLLLYVLPGYVSGARASAALQVAFGLSAIIAAAASQGGLSRYFGSLASRHVDRLLGPAARSVSTLAVRPTARLAAGGQS